MKYKEKKNNTQRKQTTIYYVHMEMCIENTFKAM